MSASVTIKTDITLNGKKKIVIYSIHSNKSIFMIEGFHVLVMCRVKPTGI